MEEEGVDNLNWKREGGVLCARLEIYYRLAVD
jgi:hypothetical protein